MRNSEYFAPEIDKIVNPTLRNFAAKYVDFFPPYFEVKPASSTGKHHAKWSNAVGGLRAHTKAVAYLAYELADAYGLSELERDAAVVAALGHDATKYGLPGGKHTTPSHASEGAIFFTRIAKGLNSMDMPMRERITVAIADHMGRWGTYDNVRDFPDGFPRISQLVHVADMAASRREGSFTFLEEGTLIG